MVPPDHFYVQSPPGGAKVPALDRPPLPLSSDPHGSHYYNTTVHYLTNDTTHTILLAGNTTGDLQMNRWAVSDWSKRCWLRVLVRTVPHLTINRTQLFVKQG